MAKQQITHVCRCGSPVCKSKHPPHPGKLANCAICMNARGRP